MEKNLNKYHVKGSSDPWSNTGDSWPFFTGRIFALKFFKGSDLKVKGLFYRI